MNSKFYTQLEGLRGIAVSLVLLSHFVIISSFPKLIFLNFGFWGVNLFFVLSGFLISEILLKELHEQKQSTKILKKFYYRRILRIFPIYYLTIIGLAIVDAGGTRSLLPWTLTYGLNIGSIWFQKQSSLLMHIWSLCVEEQFYLVWPLLLITIPRKHHLKLIIGIVISAVILRIVYAWENGSAAANFNHSAMFTCMDALGMGALLAYLKLNKPVIFKRVSDFSWLAIVIFLLFEGITYRLSEDSVIVQSLGRFLVAMAGFLIIAGGAFGKRDFLGWFMNRAVVRYLGRISYGIYIYHWILYFLLRGAFTAWWLRATNGTILQYNAYIGVFIFFFLLTIAVASLSYYLIEKPLLRFKEKPHIFRLTFGG